jgi:glucosylglycerate synthase
MAIADSISELAAPSPPVPADLLIMVAAMLPEQLEGLLANLGTIFPTDTMLIATEGPVPEQATHSLRVIAAPSANSSWSLTATEFIHARQIGQQSQAKAILMLGPGAESLAPGALLQLANSVLGGTVDLAMPRYALPPHAGLINSAVLYPLTRALFATNVRFPLAIDMAFSPRMADRLADLAQKLVPVDPTDALIWPVNEAAVAGFVIDEFDVGQRALPQPADADINTILARVTGSLFADIESKAAYWQRARRIPPTRRAAAEKTVTDGATDVPRMVESFRFAYSNLLEIWSLVLPPHSLLGLKRLSALSAAEFKMPDNLWARIVFDFLVAYRQRTINRGHLLGAFIPLYLAWVAGHINLAAAGTDSENHLETLAAAFEADKPYIVSRWRWPDRFNA